LGGFRAQPGAGPGGRSKRFCGGELCCGKPSARFAISRGKSPFCGSGKIPDVEHLEVLTGPNKTSATRGGHPVASVGPRRGNCYVGSVAILVLEPPHVRDSAYRPGRNRVTSPRAQATGVDLGPSSAVLRRTRQVAGTPAELRALTFDLSDPRCRGAVRTGGATGEGVSRGRSGRPRSQRVRRSYPRG